MKLSAIITPLTLAHHATRNIAGISVPDTPTITKAIDYARLNNDVHTYNHVMRSWLVGQASISRLPTNITANIDLEAFAVAAILHDLGWSHNPSLISPDKRYEVDGADAARDFLHKQGEGEWDDTRVQLVWDAIALYATIDIALHSQNLIAILAANIGTELFSPEYTIATLGPTKVAATMEEWEAINQEFPRKGLWNHVKDTLVGLCRTKPNSTYGTFVADWGEKYLKDEGYTRVGHRGIDEIEREIRD